MGYSDECEADVEATNVRTGSWERCVAACCRLARNDEIRLHATGLTRIRPDGPLDEMHVTFYGHSIRGPLGNRRRGRPFVAILPLPVLQEQI